MMDIEKDITVSLPKKKKVKSAVFEVTGPRNNFAHNHSGSLKMIWSDSEINSVKGIIRLSAFKKKEEKT